jgi:hypothetical protein
MAVFPSTIFTFIFTFLFLVTTQFSQSASAACFNSRIHMEDNHDGQNEQNNEQNSEKSSDKQYSDGSSKKAKAETVTIRVQQKDNEASRIVQQITSEYLPKDYFYVGIGRSPTLIIEYMKMAGLDAVNLPLSNFRYCVSGRPSLPEEFKKKLDQHLEQYLPSQSKLQGKSILLIDYTESGDTAVSAYQFVRDFLSAGKWQTGVSLLALVDESNEVKLLENHSDFVPIQEAKFQESYPSFVFVQLSEEGVFGLLLSRHVYDQYSEFKGFDITVDAIVENNPNYPRLRSILLQ